MEIQGELVTMLLSRVAVEAGISMITAVQGDVNIASFETFINYINTDRLKILADI